MTAFWSAIVNGSIVSAVLSLVVWFALSATPRRTLNAATRYAIWWIVLTVSLLLPLAYQWSPEVHFQPARAPRVESATQLPVAIPAPGVPPPPSVLAPVSRRISLPMEIPASRWPNSIALFWGAVSALLLLRLLLSYVALYRRVTKAANAPNEWDIRVAHWMAPSKRRVRVALSKEIAIPAASGPARPTILIPSHLFEQMSTGDLEQIVRHEAAHLARRDDCALLIQRVVEAVFAMHPVVRLVTRQIDLEREIACDDMVVGSCEQALSYADCLTRTVGLCGGIRNSLATANMAGGSSHLSRRVALLMSGNRGSHTAMRRRQFGVIAIVLVCVAVMFARVPQVLAFALPSPASIIYNAAQSSQRALNTLSPLALPGSQLTAQIRQTVPHSPIDAPAVTQPGAPDPSSPHILQPGDAVAISFPDHAYLSANYNIGPDGQLTVALVGSLAAGGLTIPELQARITEMFRSWVKEPIVSVYLLRNDHKWYSVAGWIPKPGSYPLLQRTTILEALVAAGGFEDVAVKENIYLLRNATTFPFNYNDAVNGTHPEQNLLLQDGDRIIVGAEGAQIAGSTGSEKYARTADETLILKPNDIVAVTLLGDIWTDRRITGKYQIGTDGQLSMARLGQFRAAGLTLAQLQALIQEKVTPLRSGIRVPATQFVQLVNVQLVRNNGPKYTLVGAVANPGPYSLLRETTVLDALAASGGFRVHAATGTISVMRSAAVMRSSERLEFNYNDVVDGRHLEQNITLRDGDIVFVPVE